MRTFTLQASYPSSGAISTTVDGGNSNRIHSYKRSTADANTSFLINSSAGIGQIAIPNIDFKGMGVKNRTSSNSAKLYINKTYRGESTLSTTKIPNLNVFLLALNSNSGAIQHDADQISFYALGKAMSETDINIITDWFNERLTYHGKNPL
jgi:hypothetical protein